MDPADVRAPGGAKARRRDVERAALALAGGGRRPGQRPARGRAGAGPPARVGRPRLRVGQRSHPGEAPVLRLRAGTDGAVGRRQGHPRRRSGRAPARGGFGHSVDTRAACRRAGGRGAAARAAVDRPGGRRRDGGGAAGSARGLNRARGPRGRSRLAPWVPCRDGRRRGLGHRGGAGRARRHARVRMGAGRSGPCGRRDRVPAGALGRAPCRTAAALRGARRLLARERGGRRRQPARLRLGVGDRGAAIRCSTCGRTSSRRSARAASRRTAWPRAWSPPAGAWRRSSAGAGSTPASPASCSCLWRRSSATG